jgi:hypothetical protein
VLVNQPFPTVRLAIWEADARARNDDLDRLTDRAPDRWAFTDRIRLLDVGFHLLPSLVFGTREHTPAQNEVSRPFLDVRPLVYGWRVTIPEHPH